MKSKWSWLLCVGVLVGAVVLTSPLPGAPQPGVALLEDGQEQFGVAMDRVSDATATLRLEVVGEGPCFNDLDCVEIEVWVRDINPCPQPVSGAQFFLQWKPGCILVDSVDPCTEGFNETVELIDNVNGLLNYAVNWWTMPPTPAPAVCETCVAVITVCPVSGFDQCMPEIRYRPLGPNGIPNRVAISGDPDGIPFWPAGHPEEDDSRLTLDPALGDYLDLGWDFEAPVITCPLTILCDTDPDTCVACNCVTAPSVTDNVSDPADILLNCTRSDDPDLNCVEDCYPLGDTTITWTAEDECGNVSTCTQTVTVSDNQDPEITCPGDITVGTDDGVCEAVVDPGTPSVWDNCPDWIVTCCRSDGPALDCWDPVHPDPYPEGCTTLTWYAIDVGGNVDICTQEVCVVDDEPPDFTCPTGREVPGNDDCQAQVPDLCAEVDDAKDNCPGDTTCTQNPPAGQVFAGCVNVTLTVCDNVAPVPNCDNSCVVQVCVDDITPPVITHCPPPVDPDPPGDLPPYDWTDLPGNDNCQHAAPNVCAYVQGTDNCDGDFPGAMTCTQVPAAGEMLPLGDTQICATITDSAGNPSLSGGCCVTVTVVDETDPVVSPPDDPAPAYTSTNDGCGPCEAYVDPGWATCDDNCCDDDPACAITWERSDDPGHAGGKPLAGCYSAVYPGETTIEWCCSDGVSEDCKTQTVTAVDDEDPVLTCPPDIEDVPNEPGECWARVDPEMHGAAECLDNCPDCGGDCSVICLRSDRLNCWDDPYPVGTTKLTWICVDAFGNSDRCYQYVTVIDTESPEIQCPSGLVVGTDDGVCTATVDPGMATCEDNCSCEVDCERDDGLDCWADPYPAYPDGEHTTSLTWTAVDPSEQDADCPQTIRVFDDQDPVAVCPPDIEVPNEAGQCWASVNPERDGLAQCLDNCPGCTITCTRDDGVDCSVHQYPVGDTVLTWRVCEAGGRCHDCNTCQQTITVTDVEPPVWNEPLPTRVTATAALGDCDAAVDPGMATAEDNCPDWTVTCERSDGKNCFSERYDVGCTTLTWRACDSADPPNCAPPYEQQVCVRSGFLADLDLRHPLYYLWAPAEDPFVRPITFTLFECTSGASLEICAEVVFDETNGTATDVFVEVPVADIQALGCGIRFTCMTVRDKLHTLRRTIDGLPLDGMVSVELTVANSKELIPGNLNDDCFIDVADFGVFLAQWDVDLEPADCHTLFPHSDCDGNGTPDLDYDGTMISRNFFQASEENCCDLDPLCGESRASSPRTSIPVAELAEMGVLNADRADLNHDGVVDLVDIELFFQGVRPEPVDPQGSSKPVGSGTSQQVPRD